MDAQSSSLEPNAKDRQKAESFYKYGQDAAQKGNFPYAIDMFRNACRIAPLELKYRQALRNAERRKFQNDPSKVGMLVGAKLQPIRLRVRTSKGRGHWVEALEHCEDAFVHHPWDIATSREFAEIAEQLGSRDLARWALENVQAQAADDPHFWRHMAHVYQFCEDWNRAILAWEKVKKLAPHDEEALRQVRALSASATIAKSGLEQAIHHSEDELESTTEPSEPDESAATPESQPASAASIEERLEQAIHQDPSRTGPYLELAEHHENQGQLDDARDVLARGLQAKPDDPVLRERYAEVQINRLKKAIEGLQARLKDHPDDTEAQNKLNKLTSKLADYELTEYRRRVERHPDDLKLRYELGLRLAAAGQHDEAIAAFQAARASPSLKVPALLQAGRCFETTGVPKLAERSYREALKAVEADDQETLNDIHYRLGRIAEQMGNLEAAEEHYNEVAANNFGYLDVAQRLRSLNQRMSS